MFFFYTEEIVFERLDGHTVFIPITSFTNFQKPVSKF